MSPTFGVALTLAITLLCGPIANAKPKSARVFLAKELPLTVVLTTPSEVMVNSSEPVRLYNRQAIQVVFSRPVIALGSDFGDGAAAKQVPFRLSCGVPGSFRWVSTTAGRWDPALDWPPDLSCSLRWNTSLRSYDGARLMLDGTPPRRALASSSLYMYGGGATSEAAARLTGGAWSSDSGVAGDKLPEASAFPSFAPSGKLLLQFSYPVNLLMLKSAFVVGAAGSGTPSNTALDVNTTCAAVEVGAALQPDTWYTLRLPAGTRYAALAGPTTYTQQVVFAGLRRFRFPLAQDAWRASSPSSGISYRRLDLWLPHGLQPGTPLDALARVLSVCELQPAAAVTGAPAAVAGGEQASPPPPDVCVPGAAPLPFTLSLPSSSRLRMTVTDLAPGKKYRVTAGADPTVIDGFGMSLEASNSTDFYMTQIAYRFEGADTTGGVYSFSNAPLAVLEPEPADNLTQWPYITIAPPPQPALGVDVPPYTSRTVRSFVLDPANRNHVIKLLQVFQRNFPNASSSGDPTAHLGLEPVSVVPVPEPLTTPGSGAGWTRVSAPLQPGAALQLLDACCTPPSYVGGPPSRRTQVLVRSGLSMSVLASRSNTVFTAWVTDASEGSGGGGVAGATVSFYVLPTSGYYREGSEPPSGTLASLVADRRLVNASSGSVHGEIQVPAGARQQPYNVMLYLPAAVGTVGTAPLDGPPPDLSAPDLLFGWNYVRSFEFTVADPRPPTAELQIVAPPWVSPIGTFTVTATAVSYIGAAVGGAPMTLTWRHARASGVLRITTDANGVATATVDLGALPEANRTTVYDAISVSVEWIGPTRERIVESASIAAADAEYALSYSLSLTPDLPGVPFGVTAILTSNTDGSDLSGIPVTATLSPATPGTAGGAACDSVATCSTSSGAGFVGPSACRLALPCLGRFSLRVCAVLPPAVAGATAVGGGSSTEVVTVCGRFEMILGRNASEWQQYAFKLRGMPMPALSLDKNVYSIGETPRLRFESPWPHARLLLLWGNDFATQSKAIDTLPAGAMADVELGPLSYDTCAGGCAVTAVLHVPRLGPSDMPLPPPDAVPVSVVCDPRAPLTYSSKLRIAVADDNGLEVVVAVGPVAGEAAGGGRVVDAGGEELLAIEPGQKAEVSVRVSGAGPGVEVTVYGVDQAVLDLMPYDLPAPQLDLVLRLAADVQVYGMAAYRLAPGAVRAVFDTLVRRLSQLDPWLPPDTAVRAAAAAYWSGGVQAADMSDEEYLDQFTTGITLLAGGYVDNNRAPLTPAFRRPPPQRRAERAPPVGGPSDPESGAGGADVSGELRSSDDFVTTPLFTTVLTGPDGVARVNFTAPANLGTFVLRAYAAATGAAAARRYGSGEGRLVVRRALSLTPSAPRFVRVGDGFEAGCVVTVGSAPARVSVTLTVRFPLSGRGIGTARLTLRAVDFQDGGGSDGLQVSMPVYGQQGDVLVATTFSLTANGTTGGGWAEGVELPAAVPGSGGLTLTAGVGNLPAITAMYANLLQQERSVAEAGDRYPYAERALTWAVLPPLLAAYGQPNTSSAAQDQQVTRGFADLGALTEPGLGLVWSDFRRWDGWRPLRADTRLNAWALFLTGLHGPALTSPPPPLPASGLGRYLGPWSDRLEAQLLPVWRRALAGQLVADAQEARANNGTYSDWHTLAWTSMGQSNPEPRLVNATLVELSSAVRLQGRTAYIAAGPGNPGPASLEDQALALLLMVRARSLSPLLPRLAAYVAAGGSSSSPALSRRRVYYPESWFVQALAAAALMSYDVSRSSAQPQLQLEADVNGLTVLEASFRPGRTQPVTTTTPWESLPPPPAVGQPGELNFEVSGRGEVSVSAALQFVPVTLPAFPTYRGLYVEAAVVDPATGQGAGPRVSGVPLGSVVALTIQVTSPDELGAVTLAVMMPAGLEPLDPHVVTDLGSGCDLGDWSGGGFGFGFGGGGGMRSRWWYWWPVCPAQETTPALVTFSYASLRSGTSTVTIKAVAASAGTFVLPPIRAWADTQPELMGMTAGSAFAVCGDCSEATPAAPPAALVPCPALDCSGNGVCNLANGACECDEGWGGRDCGKALA
eukprot:XP_001694349.1 predicted protein [Chlamydomonas reinhardtii]